MRLWVCSYCLFLLSLGFTSWEARTLPDPQPEFRWPRSGSAPLERASGFLCRPGSQNLNQTSGMVLAQRNSVYILSPLLGSMVLGLGQGKLWKNRSIPSSRILLRGRVQVSIWIGPRHDAGCFSSFAVSSLCSFSAWHTFAT